MVVCAVLATVCWVCVRIVWAVIGGPAWVVVGERAHQGEGRQVCVNTGGCCCNGWEILDTPAMGFSHHHGLLAWVPQAAAAAAAARCRRAVCHCPAHVCAASGSLRGRVCGVERARHGILQLLLRMGSWGGWLTWRQLCRRWGAAAGPQLAATAPEVLCPARAALGGLELACNDVQ